MHVITHGIGHRGQVSAVMLLNSALPAKDGLTTYLEHEAEASTRMRAAAQKPRSSIFSNPRCMEIDVIGVAAISLPLETIWRGA